MGHTRGDRCNRIKYVVLINVKGCQKILYLRICFYMIIKYHYFISNHIVINFFKCWYLFQHYDLLQSRYNLIKAYNNFKNVDEGALKFFFEFGFDLTILIRVKKDREKQTIFKRRCIILILSFYLQIMHVYKNAWSYKQWF